MSEKIVTPLTTDEKITNLLFILKHLSQYINYYNEEAIKTYIGPHGQYRREDIQKYVFNLSPIVNMKYSRSVFEEFYFNGIDKDHYYFKRRMHEVPIDIQIKEVNRDISVIEQEIECLYIFKNWELDKNAITINIDKQIIQETNLTIDSIRLAEARFPTTMYILNDDDVFYEPFLFDDIIKFKEDKDCQLLSCGYTITDENINMIHVFFIFTSKERYDKNTKIPYMILGYDLELEKGINVMHLVRDKFQVDMKNKYSDFKEAYLKLSEFLLKVVILAIEGTTFNIVTDKKIKSIYKKPKNINFIKNNYKEVYQGVLQR